MHKPSIVSIIEAAPQLSEASARKNSPALRILGSVPRPRSLFTPDARRDELVEAYPELARTCDELGFGSGASLANWSAASHWALLALARAALPPRPVADRDWSLAEISELVDDLLVHHHAPLRHELEQLQVLVMYYELRHGAKVSQGLKAAMDWVADTICAHLDFEEDVVFLQCLMVEAISRGRHELPAQELQVMPGLSTMFQGNEEHLSDLLQLRDHVARIMEQSFDPDLGLISNAIAAIIADSITHTHKEGSILLPAALFAEEVIRAGCLRNP